MTTPQPSAFFPEKKFFKFIQGPLPQGRFGIDAVKEDIFKFDIVLDCRRMFQGEFQFFKGHSHHIVNL